MSEFVVLSAKPRAQNADNSTDDNEDEENDNEGVKAGGYQPEGYNDDDRY